MASLFKNFSPRYFGNNPLKPATNLGAVPRWTQTTGTLPGVAPQVNLQSTIAPFGNPSLALNSYPGIFKLIH
jgi:hypothetical protein